LQLTGKNLYFVDIMTILFFFSIINEFWQHQRIFKIALRSNRQVTGNGEADKQMDKASQENPHKNLWF